MLVVLIQAILAAVHLLAAALASAGPLLAAGIRLGRTPRSSDPVDGALRRLGVWSVVGLVAAALAGLVTGLFRAEAAGNGYAEMLGRFESSAYWMLAAEWTFTLVCLAAWVATWRWGRRRPWLHGLVALVGATNLLYHFPPLMIAQGMLAERPGLIAEPEIMRPLLLELVYTPEVLAKTFHFWGASLMAACAAAVVLLSGVPAAPDGRSATTRRIAAVGVAATAVQLLTGVVTLVCLPAGETVRLTGGELLSTALLLASAIVALVLLHQWASLSLQPDAGHYARRLAVATGVVFLLMSFIARLSTTLLMPIS